MQGNPSQGGEVLIRMPLPDAAVILPKRDIQDPVQAVFNAPMTPNGRTELRRIVAGQAAQVVTALDTGVLTDSTLCFHQPEAAQTGPLLTVGKPVDGTGRPDAADFDAAMIPINGFMIVIGIAAKALGHGGIQERANFLIGDR